MSVPEYTLANKIRFDRDAALKLVADVKEIHAAKRGKTVVFKSADLIDDSDAVANAILGPTGNLRAPAIRIGKKLIVGFEKGMYESFFV